MLFIKTDSYDGLALLCYTTVIFNKYCKAAIEYMILSVKGIACCQLGAAL
jgi:hypothetical protein